MSFFDVLKDMLHDESTVMFHYFSGYTMKTVNNEFVLDDKGMPTYNARNPNKAGSSLDSTGENWAFFVWNELKELSKKETYSDTMFLHLFNRSFSFRLYECYYDKSNICNNGYNFFYTPVDISMLNSGDKIDYHVKESCLY